MQNNQRNQNPNQSPTVDPQLVSTVTAAVVQALSAVEQSGQQPGAGRRAAADAPKTIDLVGLMFYVIEKIWLVALAAIVGASFMGWRAGTPVPIYTATSKLYIVNPQGGGISFADLQLGSQLTMDYQEVFKTWEVHEMVREELNLPYSYAQMQGMISVTNPEDTRLMYISATHHDPQTAADIANAYAKAAKSFIINVMRGEEPSDFSIALEPSIARIVSKSSSVIMGFMLGIVLAVGILTLLFVLDDRPRTPEHISMYGGIPTLAILPSMKEVRRNIRRENRSRARAKGKKHEND